MTGTEDHFEVKDHATGAFVRYDLRYFPYFIADWNGVPTTSLVDAFFKVRRDTLQRAADQGLKSVQISDLTNFGTPPATVRKYLGDIGKTQDREYTATFMGYITIVPNAIVRGVVTALYWIGGDEVKPSVFVSSVGDAFSKDFTKALGVDLRSMTYTPPG